MKPYLRAFAIIPVLLLCVAEVFWAQSRTQRPDDTSKRAADGAGGTMVKKAPVVTDDDIAKLTVRKRSAAPETLVAKSNVGAGVDVFSAAADPEKAQAELAALRQQLKDKQKQLELLMNMFVTDEQMFIRNPNGQSGEDDAQMKRRFEQEELRQEAAEIAKLRTRVESMTKALEEKATPATR